MKNIIEILLLLCICTASTCEKKEDNENCHLAIKFSNNTERSLYVRSAQYNVYHPFSSEIKYLSNTVEATSMYKVNGGEQDNRNAMLLRSCHESFFGRDGYSDTLTVYVFDASVVENTPWEIVARDYLVLKRYDLSLEDLRRLDWRITYPSTEAMKNIKQYPPYE